MAMDWLNSLWGLGFEAGDDVLDAGTDALDDAPGVVAGRLLMVAAVAEGYALTDRAARSTPA